MNSFNLQSRHKNGEPRSKSGGDTQSLERKHLRSATDTHSLERRRRLPDVPTHSLPRYSHFVLLIMILKEYA